MPLRQILYVSESVIPAASAREELALLVNLARSRNERLEVSGCLLFSGARFAQMLEGRDAHVEKVMRSILRDRRHQNIEIIVSKLVSARCFSSWGLGFGGPSIYVSKVIERAGKANSDSTGRGVENLIKLMMHFASDLA